MIGLQPRYLIIPQRNAIELAALMAAHEAVDALPVGTDRRRAKRTFNKVRRTVRAAERSKRTGY